MGRARGAKGGRSYVVVGSTHAPELGTGDVKAALPALLIPPPPSPCPDPDPER